MRYAFVIDQSRCIGCHACSLACKAEHEVPLGSYRTWVKYVENGSFPNVRRTFSVLRCNHCDAAPCIDICPVTALFRRDDGIVDFDRDVCIGCKACMQACPYDALYIHPEKGTAEKCNFCAHRVDIGLEPPCATVCPTESILVGDLDNPKSRVAQIVATKKVDVRKPEKGTSPKVFYVDAEPRALTPGAADPTGGYLWADQPGAALAAGTATERGPQPSAAVGGSAGAGTQTNTGPLAWMETDVPPPGAAQALAAAAMRGEADFFTGAWAGLSPSRTVYDVAHAASPWGWKVSAYLWTKSIAAGALLVAALAPWIGLPEDGHASLAAPLIGMLFLAITGVLLVADLKRPERFWTILTRPNWTSWLARGAFIIAAFGVLGAAWTALALIGGFGGGGVGFGGGGVGFGGGGVDRLYGLLRWPLVAAALATAGYSGYLFAQAKGRDFWQSPLLPVHLAIQATAAGTASLGLLAALVGEDTIADSTLGTWLAASLAAHLALVAAGEITVAHATRDGARAARALSRGELAGWFWAGMVLTVIGFVIVATTGLSPGPLSLLATVATLAGLAAYEHAWNLAGQLAPLS